MYSSDILPYSFTKVFIIRQLAHFRYYNRLFLYSTINCTISALALYEVDWATINANLTLDLSGSHLQEEGADDSN